MPATKVFLLSPASLNGIRAKQLMSPRAKFEAAQLYRSPEGGVGLCGAGLVMAYIGCTQVFVDTDLVFMRTTAAELRRSFEHLVPLVAHDRASLGGMLIANGVALRPMGFPARGTLAVDRAGMGWQHRLRERGGRSSCRRL